MAFKWTAARIAAASERLQAYEQTPHRHRRAEPGIGVDCVHLVVEALKAASVIPAEFVVPGYQRNTGYMKSRNHAADLFAAAFYTKEVSADEIEDGDVLFFAVNRTTNHVGICMGGDVWHCTWTAGVLRDPPSQIAPMIETVLRFTRTGTR
jgi:cell wall-associated NlpC family hydrolase